MKKKNSGLYSLVRMQVVPAPWDTVCPSTAFEDALILQTNNHILTSNPGETSDTRMLTAEMKMAIVIVL